MDSERAAANVIAAGNSEAYDITSRGGNSSPMDLAFQVRTIRLCLASIRWFDAFTGFFSRRDAKTCSKLEIVYSQSD